MGDKPAEAKETGLEMTDYTSSQDPSINREIDIGTTEKQFAAAVPFPEQTIPPPIEPIAAPKPSNASQTNEKNALTEQKDNDPFAHLPEHEAAVLRRQLDVPDAKVTYFGLYRYATRMDHFINFISAICAIAAGAALPLMTIVFGNLTGVFKDFFYGTLSKAEFSHQIDHLTLYFVYLAIGEFVTVYIATVGFIYTGEHMTGKVREHYLASILRQNIGYFDKLGAGEITTRITADTNLVQEAISEKVGLTLTALSTFVTAYIIGYIKYWKLTLILTSTIVAIVVSMLGLGVFLIRYNRESLAAYGEGGTVVEEVISSIRNAVAFGTQNKLANEYDRHLQRAEIAGYRTKAIAGSLLGLMFCLMYLSYSLAFWLGSHYIVNGESDLQSVLTILLAIMIGAFSLSNVAPMGQAFTTGASAATKIFSTIDRVSPLDPSSDAGKKLEKIEGVVELRGIKHIYPSRPEVVVMDGVDLLVPAGKTTALVGASGSGKSTIVGLVERFYDPVGGAVLLDGENVQDLNLRWLRQQISLVSQEPTLFATTIASNIRHGLIGTKYEHMSEEETRELVENAARKANAHDFVSNLPDGYQTHVGERGFLLSGGQKQRIAIARAIVSDPKILLLDEATSALDTKSEGVVQAALDKAAEGRTTIVIAHRLSTIKNADNIVVMSRGRIVEQGKHDDLLQQQGVYFNLVEAQRISQENEARREIEEAEDDAAIPDLEKKEVLASVSEAGDASEDVNLKDLELGRTKTSQSASSKIIANKSTETKHNYSFMELIAVASSFNKQEWIQMLIGTVCAIIAGAGQPVQSVFFAKVINDLSLPPVLYNKLLSGTAFWAWMYFMLALVLFIACTIQGLMFAMCSERLVHRARDTTFRAILRQDIAFFDREENTAGALTSFLSTEATHLAGISGATLGTIFQVLTTLVVGFIIALAIGWKLALVCIATVPVVLSCGALRFSMLFRLHARAKQAYEKSASYACEATSAIRTVASLTREEDVWKNYHEQLVSQLGGSLASVAKSSIFYAASQSFILLCSALGFWYGSTLISSGELDLFQFFLCFAAVIFGAQSAGVIFTFAPDLGKAKHAAAEIKTLLERQPSIDTWSKAGDHLPSIQGDIEFRDVHFRYPTRPDQPVLRGLNLTVRPGQYVALVGASGCGKSTTIALLERFYDPLVGGVFVDGHDISSLNINSYRNHLALVSQEPTLYQGTIRENILLGAETLPEDVPEAAIIQACKDANIYDFIMSLPDAFNTVVGNKGSMLSGGQKQRLAIARALLRDPKILLLDEATSALDSESEKVVQAALDKAAKGRTTVAVAHRLSTIQKADVIYVFDAGRIVESGTHKELLQQKGAYYELVNLQSLEGH